MGREKERRKVRSRREEWKGEKEVEVKETRERTEWEGKRTGVRPASVRAHCYGL